MKQTINRARAGLAHPATRVGSAEATQAASSGARWATLRRAPWVRAAEAEEARGETPSLSPGLARLVAAVRGPGVPVATALRAPFERASGQSLGDVRLHTGEGARHLTRLLGARGVAAGRDVFLAEGPERSGAGDPVLQHELTHLARFRGRPRIGLWGSSGHEALTRAVSADLVLDQVVIPKLASASAMMDLRPRRVARAFPAYLNYLGMSKTSPFGGSPERDAIREPFPAEGVEHGEGGMYVMSRSAARPRNVAAQNRHLAAAIAAFTATKSHYRRADMDPSVVRRLGDALHIAQDRAAHGEGARGMGHDDPRAKARGSMWSPDNPAKNPTAYREAYQNTTEVIAKFIKATRYYERGIWYKTQNEKDLELVEEAAKQWRKRPPTGSWGPPPGQ